MFQEILSEMADQNLHPDSLELDGKIHRFKDGKDDHKNSGWYVGFQNHTRKSGELFYVVVYGSYRHYETYKYQSNVTLSADDKKSIKEQLKKAQAQSEKERQANQEQVAGEVEDKWLRLAQSGDSDYLRKKQIVECAELGVRYEFGGSIYVPMRDVSGKLWSLQRIDFQGTKLFHAGGRVRGCFHTLGDLEGSGPVAICEGLATGASIRLATGYDVVVAFTAGNLEAISSELKQAYPDRSFLICGDDDRFKKENSGKAFAESAAKRCLGKVVFPRFASKESKGTDFNDLHVEEGLQAVKDQIGVVQTERAFVVPLGFRETDYFYTSSSNKQLVAISAFTETNLLNLMPLSYWEALYPGESSAVSWSVAKSDLMEKARARGIFRANMVRGAGVWNDEGRIVVNMGDHLLVDGDRVELGQIKSRYFYTMSAKIPAIHSQPLTAKECEVLTNACENFRWQKKDFGFLLAGALVVSRVCGALPVRPHVWLTGEAGSGKSTLFNRLILPVLGEPKFSVHGNTSEAGIRQSLAADAVPVIFDEFETVDVKSSERIQAIIDLMRVAWSESDAAIVKGSAGGSSTAYQARFSAIVSSIRTNLKTDADRSRFSIIELAPHGSDAEHWKQLDHLLAQIDDEYSARLFARAIRMVPVLIQNYKTLKKLFAGTSGQRFGDQYGMLLAGYSILMQDEPINEHQARLLINHITLEEEREAAKIADQQNALEHLLTSKLSFDMSGVKVDLSVAEAIGHAFTDSDANKALQRYGIKVCSSEVSIAQVHTGLEKAIFQNTRWSNQWASSLARLPGAVKNKAVWLSGRTVKCVALPRALFGIS